MRQPCVLIIDDDPMVAELLELQFAGKGCDILRASTGEVGLEVMKDHVVDLVLTDFMMPHLNGMEFTRRVKGRPEWANTKIVFMSANTGMEHRQRASGLGASDYLPKNLGPEMIACKVLEHLGRAKGELEVSAEGAIEAEQRLQRIELLAEHLLEVLELADVDKQASAATRRALELAAQTAMKIRDAANPAGSNTGGSIGGGHGVVSRYDEVSGRRKVG